MNRAARLIYSLPPGTPTTRFLIELHWLPIKARIEFKICLMTFKVIKFGEPKYLADLLFSSNSDTGVTLCSASDPYLSFEPRAINERHFAARSFTYVAPR